MIRYGAATVEALADKLAGELAAPPADVFAEDLVLTRGGGIGRWLAQRLSLVLGAAGARDGVAARIRFTTPGGFAASLEPEAAPGGAPPWSAGHLTGLVLAGLDDLPSDPVFGQVLAHLGDPAARPRRRTSFARAVAGRFAAYAAWQPAMLERWQMGEFVLPDDRPVPPDQLWQPELWNLILTRAGTTPGETARRAAGLARAVTGLARVAVFCPEPLTPADEALLAALDETHPVAVFALAHEPHAAASLVAGRLAAQAGATQAGLARLAPAAEVLAAPASGGSPPVSLLGAIQAGLSLGHATAVPSDDSVQLHAVTAGEAVERLADFLVALLEADKSLEPRDILVLVHRMEAWQEALSAWLRPDDTPGAGARHRIRALVTATDPPRGTPAEVLFFLMELVHGRATAADLIRLIRFPAVMDNFSFGPGDADRLAGLVEASGIRWGLNAPHRASAGMAGFTQNTWIAGLGRLVLGVALREDDLVYVRSVLPLDVADSDGVRLVEALGAIITHVRDCCDTWGKPVPAGVWADRFRASLDFLTGGQWTGGPVPAAITTFETTAPTGPLTTVEAQSFLAGAWAGAGRRSAALNGDLAAQPLGSMSLVPHKVIVLFGLDADSYPGLPPADGDDLAAEFASPEFEPRAATRQVFYDALMSAREKFVAFYTGFDPATPDASPVPSPLIDLAEVARAFTDPAGPGTILTIHEATVFPPVTTPAAHLSRLPEAVAPPPDEVGIDDVADLFANPASHWLRRNAGLAPAVLKEDEALPGTMAIALSGLDAWQVTNRMLRLLLAGKAGGDILAAELRRGSLPPGEAGAQAGGECLARAEAIARRARPLLAEPVKWQGIALPHPGAPELTGQVAVRGDTICEVMAGRVQPRHQIAVWIRLLALAQAHPGRVWRAVLIGHRDLIQLTAPAEAAHHLDRLRSYHVDGLARPLPLPAAPAAHLARFLARDLVVDMAGVDQRLKAEWSRDPGWSLIWPTPDDLKADPDFTKAARDVYVPLMRAGGVS